MLHQQETEIGGGLMGRGNGKAHEITDRLIGKIYAVNGRNRQLDFCNTLRPLDL